MKIQKERGRRSGIRAVLCGIISVFCIAFCAMEAEAGYTSDNHPKAQLTPDGTGWTIIEDLPYYEDYNTFTADGKHWNGKTFSFWSKYGTEYMTGMELNLPNPGVGQHIYAYKRSGLVPIYKWLVTWESSKCIHDYNGTGYRGFSGLENKKCYNAYWSGLLPLFITEEIKK